MLSCPITISLRIINQNFAKPSFFPVKWNLLHHPCLDVLKFMLIMSCFTKQNKNVHKNRRNNYLSLLFPSETIQQLAIKGIKCRAGITTFIDREV